MTGRMSAILAQARTREDCAVLLEHLAQAESPTDVTPIRLIALANA